MKKDVILVKIIEEVAKMALPSVNFQVGRPSQILSGLNMIDNSITDAAKASKYPMIAMIIPATEERGSEKYATVRIPRIVLATMTRTGEGSEVVLSRYDPTNTFVSVLYPLYYNFMDALATHPEIENQDPDAIRHRKVDNPGIQPIVTGTFSDYVDCIDILDLEITLVQIKNC